MAATMASTFAGSRPSEKFGTHSTSCFMGQRFFEWMIAPRFMVKLQRFTPK